MAERYRLEGKRAVLEPDLMTWAAWFETADRRVARDEIGGCVVSTVFLGLDHRFGPGLPILFETLVFGAPDDFVEIDGRRYSTWAAAEAGHREFVERLKAAADSVTLS